MFEAEIYSRSRSAQILNSRASYYQVFEKHNNSTEGMLNSVDGILKACLPSCSSFTCMTSQGENAPETQHEPLDGGSQKDLQEFFNFRVPEETTKEESERRTLSGTVASFLNCTSGLFL